jgi:dienelactone hydrolase
MKTFLLFLLAAVVVCSASAEVKMEKVTYKQGDTVLEGFLVYDSAVKGTRPGVVLVHDWMGVGEYVQMRARQVAEMGYVAFVADIYGKGVRPANTQEASTQAGIYRGDRPLLRARARAAFDQLAANPLVDAKHIAAIGYCFGGGTVLELARSGAPLAGVISFHGNLDTPHPEDAKQIKGKVLVLHGADDPYVPAAAVEAFQKEMKDAHVDYEFTAYGGAVHAFTQKAAGDDPSKGAAYNASADARSFARMKSFFKELFGKQ